MALIAFENERVEKFKIALFFRDVTFTFRDVAQKNESKLWWCQVHLFERSEQGMNNSLNKMMMIAWHFLVDKIDTKHTTTVLKANELVHVLLWRREIYT